MNSLTRTEDQSLLSHYDLVGTVKKPYSEFFDLMLMPKLMIPAIWITNFQSCSIFVSYYLESLPVASSIIIFLHLNLNFQLTAFIRYQKESFFTKLDFTAITVRFNH